jgi:hypothetical protein
VDVAQAPGRAGGRAAPNAVDTGPSCAVCGHLGRPSASQFGRIVQRTGANAAIFFLRSIEVVRAPWHKQLPQQDLRFEEAHQVVLKTPRDAATIDAIRPRAVGHKIFADQEIGAHAGVPLSMPYAATVGPITGTSIPAASG